MQIELAKECNPALLGEVNSLLPQLSGSAQNLALSELKTIVESDTTHLLIAAEEGRVFGFLVLVVFRIPTGIRSWIEDVVVSEASRGKGIGKLLLEAAVQLAREQGAKTIDLTSRPSREAANHLYQKTGFQQRDTNVYRLAL